MARLTKYLTILLIIFFSTKTSVKAADPWLVLEGINAAIQGGKIVSEKIKDKISDQKYKKNKKEEQKRNIEYQNYLAAIDNCKEIEGKGDGWVYRNVCEWAARKWHAQNAKTPPFLMSKAWAQNNEGDYAWEFGPDTSSAASSAAA